MPARISVLGLGALVALGIGAAALRAGAGTSTPAPNLSTYALKSDVPGLAPVQSVNGAQGQVAVPTVQRQVSAALDASAGAVTWPFPNAFTNQPTCWESLATSSTSYSYDAPIVTAISKTSVSLKLSAHPSSLSVTSLALPISLPLTVNPPTGTTVTLSCVGALP